MSLESKDGIVQISHLWFNSKISSIARTLFGIEQSHVVICGFPRSGTSLLYNMISSTIKGFKLTEFEKYFIHYIHKIGNYITKAPIDILHLKHIDKLNINNKKIIILIVVRDIRDVITSRHPIHPDEFFIGYDHSWWPQDREFSTWSYDAPGVIEIHRAIQEVMGRTDAMLIRYEELVKNPEAVQENIKKRFAISFDAKFHEYHQNPDKHAYRYEGKFAPKKQSLVMEGKRISLDRVARWKQDGNQIDRVKKQFIECPELFDVLEAYGYEVNKDWFERIDP